MTSPLPLDEIDAQGDEVIAAEEAAAAAAAAELRAEIAAIAALALAAWEDDGDSSALLGDVANRLRGLRFRLGADAERRLLDAFAQAYALGIEHGARQLGDEAMGVAHALPPDVRREASAGPLRARTRLVEAAEGMAGVTSLTELQAALARADRAPAGLANTATWGVNRAHASGITTVAEAHDAQRAWVTERDGCVHCMRYAGLSADPGFPFPGGLTFGRKPLSLDPVPNPPLHPNCRCRVMLWRREWPTDYLESLQREARRSIARGWSLETESNAQRLAAAQRLLAQGARLPKSVEDYARRALRTGRFPRGRSFPA